MSGEEFEKYWAELVYKAGRDKDQSRVDFIAGRKSGMEEGQTENSRLRAALARIASWYNAERYPYSKKMNRWIMEEARDALNETPDAIRQRIEGYK